MKSLIYVLCLGALALSSLSVFRAIGGTEETLSGFSVEFSEDRFADLNVRLAGLRQKLNELESRSAKEMSKASITIGPQRSLQQVAAGRIQRMEAKVEELLSRKIAIARELGGQGVDSNFRGKVSSLYLQRVSNASLPERERVMALQMVRGVSNELPDEARTFALGVLDGSIDATSHMRVLRLINGIEDDRFVEPLLRLLRSAKSSVVREEAAESLSTFAPRIRVVLKALNLAARADKSERVRTQAMKSTSNEMLK